MALVAAAAAADCGLLFVAAAPVLSQASGSHPAPLGRYNPEPPEAAVATAVAAVMDTIMPCNGCAKYYCLNLHRKHATGLSHAYKLWLNS